MGLRGIAVRLMVDLFLAGVAVVVVLAGVLVFWFDKAATEGQFLGDE